MCSSSYQLVPVFMPWILPGRALYTGTFLGCSDGICVNTSCRACETGAEDAVRELLRAGANVEGIDKNGDSILMSAVRSCSVKVVRKIVEAGHPVDVKDNEGRTPLLQASTDGSLDICKVRAYYFSTVRIAWTDTVFEVFALKRR